MKIKDILQRIRKGFHREDPLSNEVLQGFLRVLENARTEDISCNEVFAQLDQYVEKEVKGEDAARLMPLLREHLDLCSDCCDEYEALMTVLERSADN
jgi:hypothetical protein